ncbi:MAG: hypothetical protein CL608_28700 [Anaerolineaceae bacterium]|nr:hypothetical protein [Anaerolineaceae bacterium]
MTHNPLSVLFVDDEASLRTPLSDYLRKHFGFAVVEAANYDEALNAVASRQQTFDVALLDDMLMRSADSEPERLGLDLVHAIREISAYTEFILLTGWGLDKDWQAMEHGVFRIVKKATFDPDEIGYLVRQASEFGRLKTTAVEKRIMEQLMETSPLLLNDAKLEDIQTTILHAIHAIGFDRVRLYHLSDDRQYLVGRAQFGMSPDFVGHYSPVEQHPNIQTLFEEQRPIIVPYLPGKPAPFEHDDSLTEWGCIPLVVEDEVIGKIGVDNIQSRQAITLTELRPIAIFANQVAAAIQTARSQQKMEVIRQVTETLKNQKTLQEILNTLCRSVVELFDIEHSGFVIFDDAYQSGRVVAEYPEAVGIGGRHVQIEGVPAEQKLVNRHEPIVVEDVATCEELGEVKNLLLEFDIQSIMAVPSIVQGKPLGSFSLDAIGRKRLFSAEEIELCQILATHAATAIDKSRVYEEAYHLTTDSPMAILANNRGGKITYCNKRAALLLNYDESEIIGRHVGEIFYHSEEPSNIGNRLRSSPDGRLIDYETIARTKTGMPIPVRLSVSWLYDGLGEHRGALGHFEDIRSYKRLSGQSMLQQQITDALQSADKLDEVYYLIVTGATAGFGLGLNRAALFLRDFEEEKLIGVIGLGYFDPDENQQVWESMDEHGLDNLKVIREQLNSKIPQTPLGKRVVGLEIPIRLKEDDVFSKAVAEGHWQYLESEIDIKHLPLLFKEQFEPHFPFLITALRSRGEVIGLLVADNKFNHHPIEDETIQSLITLANTAAIAISRVQLLEQTRQQAIDLERVNREIRRLSQSEGRSLLQAIIERSIDLLSATNGGIYEYDNEHNLLCVIADYSDVHPSIVGRRLKIGEGMAGKLVQSGEPYMTVSDYAQWDGRANTYEDKRQFGAILEVLLKWRDEIVGVLFIEDKVGREFSAEDVRLLRMFADHAAIALKNSKLLENEQLAWKQLKDSFEASIALAVAENPRVVLETAIERAQVVNGALNAGVVLLDNQNRATALHFSGEGWRRDVENIVRPNGGISVRVKQTGIPHVCSNTENDPDINPRMPNKQAKAAVCLPFTVHNEHVGVMWVHYHKPRTFKDAEIATLMLYAKQAAAAYDQARKIETLQYMQEAAESLSSTNNVEAVLHQIVASAVKVLHAKSAAILSYDDMRDQFVRDEAVAVNVTKWEANKHDLHRGHTTHIVINNTDVIDIEDVSDETRYSFLGKKTRKMLQLNGVGSFQGVRLSVGDEKLGVLFVDYANPRDFSAEERRNVTTLANHAAIALKKARLLDKVQHAYDTAKLIARLNVDKGLDATLKAVVKGAIDVFGCDAVVLYVYDTENACFEYPPKMEGVIFEGRVRRYKQIPDSSIVFEILKRTEPYLCSDTTEDPKFQNRRFTEDEDIKSLVAFPLRIQEESVGVLFINYRHQRTLAGEEIANIQLFADQAAVAIHDALLYERERKRAGTLESLSDASKAVMSSLDLKAVLDTIAERAWKLAKVQEKNALFCDILLADGSVGEIVSAYPQEKLGEIHEKLGSHIDWEAGIKGRYGITGHAYRTGKNQRVPDVRKNPHFLKSHEETRSAMAICIKYQEEIIGFIVAEHEEVDAFTDWHERILEALAAPAAVAISHAQYVEEIRRIKGFVGSHNAIKWMEMVSLGWGHDIRRAIGEVKNHAYLLNKQLARKNNHAALAKLTELVEAVDDILQIPLTEPLTSEKAIVSLSLNKELSEYFAHRWQNSQHRDKSISLQLLLAKDVDAHGTIRASRAWLRQLCEIVSDNSIEAMMNAQTLNARFTVRTQCDTSTVTITFEDNGPGIPVEIQSQLFQDRIEKEPGEKGAGIGLMQAAAIAQTYGGTVEHDATYSDGARFFVQLPFE